MSLRWLPQSKTDIARLHNFLISKNPRAAEQAARAILEAADKLIEFPEIGKPLGDAGGHRDLLIPFGSRGYVLRYRRDGEHIVVARVWHSRERRE